MSETTTEIQQLKNRINRLEELIIYHWGSLDLEKHKEIDKKFFERVEKMRKSI